MCLHPSEKKSALNNKLCFIVREIIKEGQARRRERKILNFVLLFNVVAFEANFYYAIRVFIFLRPNRSAAGRSEKKINTQVGKLRKVPRANGV